MKNIIWEIFATSLAVPVGVAEGVVLSFLHFSHLFPFLFSSLEEHGRCLFGGFQGVSQR